MPVRCCSTRRGRAFLEASPLDTVKALWSGELPEFESLEAANELLRVLIMGFSNQLACHQDRRSPFRLLRTDLIPIPKDVARVVLIWSEELDAFLMGSSEPRTGWTYRNKHIVGCRFRQIAPRWV